MKKTDRSRRNVYLRRRGAPGALKKPIFGGVLGVRREKHEFRGDACLNDGR